MNANLRVAHKRRPAGSAGERRWKEKRVPMARIEQHIEELGKLADARQIALASGDGRRLRKIAKEYCRRGMAATAREVEEEAGNL